MDNRSDEYKKLISRIDQIFLYLDRGPKLAYSVDEAVEATSISKSALYEDMAAGLLRARKRGSRTFFLTADLEAYVASHPMQRHAPRSD